MKWTRSHVCKLIACIVIKVYLDTYRGKYIVCGDHSIQDVIVQHNCFETIIDRLDNNGKHRVTGWEAVRWDETLWLLQSSRGEWCASLPSPSWSSSPATATPSTTGASGPARRRRSVNRWTSNIILPNITITTIHHLLFWRMKKTFLSITYKYPEILIWTWYVFLLSEPKFQNPHHPSNT